MNALIVSIGAHNSIIHCKKCCRKNYQKKMESKLPIFFDGKISKSNSVFLLGIMVLYPKKKLVKCR